MVREYNQLAVVVHDILCLAILDSLGAIVLKQARQLGAIVLKLKLGHECYEEQHNFYQAKYPR